MWNVRSVCPAAKRTDYYPREMLRGFLQDDETVVDDDTIWYCFSCSHVTVTRNLCSRWHHD